MNKNNMNSDKKLIDYSKVSTNEKIKYKSWFY